MGAGEYIVAVDIGTGSCRALLFDQELRVYGQCTVDLRLAKPAPDRAEQDPDEVCSAVFTCIHAVTDELPDTARRIAGICLGVAVSSLLLVDKNSKALTPAAIWADTRAAQQAQRLAEQYGLALYQRTGCPLHASYLPAKLRWWQEIHPEVLADVAKAISLKEYVLFDLCAEYLIDYSTACAAGLLNIESLDWDGQALEAAGIDQTYLSTLVPTTYKASLSPDAAARLGLSAGLPVIVGATDGVLSNLGAGAVAPGELVTMVGSSGAVRLTTAAPYLDPAGRTWCYPLIAGERWVAGGANNVGGLALDWVAYELLGLSQSIDVGTLVERALRMPPGSDGLVFFASLMGERCPLWDEKARGVFFGLSDQHTQEHALRATLEAILYSLHSIYRILTAENPADSIKATGGYARSHAWVALQASVFGRAIEVPAEVEGSALGAAILGWLALGYLRSLEEGAKSIRTEKTFEPEPDLVPVYDRALLIHEALYQRLHDLY